MVKLKSILSGFLLAATALVSTAHAQVALHDYIGLPTYPGEQIHIPSMMAMWCDDTSLIASTPPLEQACTPRVTSKAFPVPVQFGSTATIIAVPYSGPGTDFSNAQPSVGNVLKTYTVVHPSAYYVQNQCATDLTVVYDNGTGGITSTQLLKGVANNSQGGDTSPPLIGFVGRIRVTGLNGCQFMGWGN